ncbi:MAG: hypothetical protein WAQ57_02395 [Candidatus Saccharimonadales bacterium]
MKRKRKGSSYRELLYRLPPVPAKKAAALAVKRIDMARRIDVGYLVYLLQHSNILLLANLRAHSPYVSFSNDMSGKRMQRFEQLMRSLGVYVLPETRFDPKEPVSSYSLVSPKGIERIPLQYGFITPEVPLWRRPFEPTDTGLALWAMETEQSLAVMMERGQLPQEWLQDWWAPADLRFGMSLGYPGAAISSLLWHQANQKMGGRQFRLPEVNVTEEDELLGARVGFSTSEDTLDYPEITGTHALWDEVIQLVINHFGAEKLDYNKMFLREFHAYKKSEDEWWHLHRPTDVIP